MAYEGLIALPRLSSMLATGDPEAVFYMVWAVFQRSLKLVEWCGRTCSVTRPGKP